MQQSQAEGKQHQNKDDNDGIGKGDVDVRNAQETEAERVDHVQDWIGHGYPLPELRQQVDGIENAAEVSQRCQHESRYDGNVVETFGKDRIDKPAQREQYCRQDNHTGEHSGVVNSEITEKK